MPIVPCPVCRMRVVPKGVACPSCGHAFTEDELKERIHVDLPGREGRPESRHRAGRAARSSQDWEEPWRGPVDMPAVVKWFGVYALVMAFLYFALVAIGVVLLFNPEGAAAGIVLVIMGLVFFAPFLIALLMEDGSARWTLALVLICLGLTGGCTLPFCAVMLVYWIKPETRDYFLQDNTA